MKTSPLCPCKCPLFSIITTTWFTQHKQWGLYQNKVTSSLAAIQRPGHWIRWDNPKMVYCNILISRNLMFTSTEFINYICVPLISTSFNVRVPVKGRLMCIALCPNIVLITVWFFCHDQLSHLAIDASSCMKLYMNHRVKYVTINRMSPNITTFWMP